MLTLIMLAHTDSEARSGSPSLMSKIKRVLVEHSGSSQNMQFEIPQFSSSLPLLKTINPQLWSTLFLDVPGSMGQKLGWEVTSLDVDPRPATDISSWESDRALRLCILSKCYSPGFRLWNATGSVNTFPDDCEKVKSEVE